MLIQILHRFRGGEFERTVWPFDVSHKFEGGAAHSHRLLLSFMFARFLGVATLITPQRRNNVVNSKS